MTKKADASISNWSGAALSWDVREITLQPVSLPVHVSYSRSPQAVIPGAISISVIGVSRSPIGYRSILGGARIPVVKRLEGCRIKQKVKRRFYTATYYSSQRRLSLDDTQVRGTVQPLSKADRADLEGPFNSGPLIITYCSSSAPDIGVN